MIDAKFVVLDGGGADAVRDVDGRLNIFLATQDWAAMIVRPDYYVYGGVAAEADVPALVDDLLADLAEAGVRFGTVSDIREDMREARAI